MRSTSGRFKPLEATSMAEASWNRPGTTRRLDKTHN